MTSGILAKKNVSTRSSRRKRFSSIAMPTASAVNSLLTEYSVWLSSARKGAACISATTLPCLTTITWWISHPGIISRESIMLMTAWVLMPSAAGVLRGRSSVWRADSHNGSNASNATSGINNRSHRRRFIIALS